MDKMTIIILQVAALAMVALLLREPAPEPVPQEVREPNENESKK